MRPAIGCAPGMRSLPRWGLWVLLSSGCASAPSPPADPGPEVAAYAPLEAGSFWTYAVRFPGQTGERTVRLVGVDEDGWWVDDAGGAFRISRAGLRDRERVLIRAPLEVGRTWKAVLSPRAVEHYRLASIGEACTARAGRFEDCLVVRSRLRRDEQVSLEVTFTWARDVGLVKVETAALIDGRSVPQTEQSLIRYRIGEGRANPQAPAPADEGPEGPDTWDR